jgi:hypothetical protein
MSMITTATTSKTQSATIAEGVGCVRAWQRGDGRHLIRFMARDLTGKGAAYLMAGLNRAASEDYVRELVASAVAMGY